MKIAHSKYFEKRLKKRINKDHSLKRKVGKQLKLLKLDFRHPSLKTHKLKGRRVNEYAIWVEGDLRIVFIIEDDTVLLTDFIKHDEY